MQVCSAILAISVFHWLSKDCAILNGATIAISATLSYMATPHRTQFQRLILQIERDLAAQAQLRTLLTVAERTVADDRHELRTIKARMKRTRH